MKAEFDIKLTQKDLYAFNMRQTYRGIHGIISILIAIVAFVITFVSYGKVPIGYTILYPVMGLVILFYIPVALKLRVKMILKTNAVLSGNLHFLVSEENITVTQGEENGVLEWNQVYKLVAGKKYIYIFSNRQNAYILPKEQLGDNYDKIVEIAKAKLEKFRLISK